MDLYPVCMCSVICFSMSYVWYGQSRIEPYHYCFMHIVWMANRRINRESKIQVPISELIIHSHKHDDEKQNYFAIDNNLSCGYTSVTHIQLVCVTLSLSYQNRIILSQKSENVCLSLFVKCCFPSNFPRTCCLFVTHQRISQLVFIFIIIIVFYVESCNDCFHFALRLWSIASAISTLYQHNRDYTCE